MAGRRSGGAADIVGTGEGVCCGIPSDGYEGFMVFKRMSATDQIYSDNARVVFLRLIQPIA
jgi:hypothetical protein